jgi:ribosome maturation factor RimP
MSKVWNMVWRSPVKDKVFNYSKPFARHYHSNANEKEWLKPQTAIGVSEFKKLVLNSTVFVDKSLLIKDFLEDSGETLLMTFPRRWGKSINIDMIKTFLGLEVNKNGEPLPIEKRENHKLFLGGETNLGLASGRKKLLTELKIAKYQDIILERQGQFPVVSIDFKNTKGNSYEEVLNKVKIELRNTFLSHEYLTTSSKLKEDEIQLFDRYIDSLKHQNLTPAEVSVGLKNLCTYLYKHFGKKSYVLMDEYDAAINHSHINLPEEASGKIIQIFRNMNETTFKGNNYLEKGLITGVFRIAKANLFSGLNNLNEYNILDKKFFQYYGFTQQEVEYLLKQYRVPEDLAQDIKDWYNGYMLKDCQTYNPWSIVKCLNKFEDNRDIQDRAELRAEILKNYWEESGNIDFIKPLFKVPAIKNKVDRLVKDESLVFNLKRQISVDDFKILKEVMNLGSNYQIDESVSDILFSYLFSAGYLTTDAVNRFKLPNNEVKTELQNKLLEYYEQQYNIDMELFTDVTDQLQKILDSNDKAKIKAAIESFKESFKNLLAEFPQFGEIKDKNIGE